MGLEASLPSCCGPVACYHVPQGSPGPSLPLGAVVINTNNNNNSMRSSANR